MEYSPPIPMMAPSGGGTHKLELASAFLM